MGITIALLSAILIFVFNFTPTDKERGAQVAAVSAAEMAFKDLSLEAKSAIVIDLKDKKVLFEKNPDAQLPLASITKVPLALAVAEAFSPDTTLQIPHDITSALGVKLFGAGEEWRVQDLIDGTLITSSNNGAEFLASAAEGNIREQFPAATVGEAALWRMNDIAHSLGMTQTYFLNVSGLDISETLAGAYGSARDVAALFAHVSKSYSSVFAGTARGDTLLTSVNGASEATAQNTNESEGVISGLIMGKTGFTDLAGGNLAVVFDVGIGHPVAVVVLGSTIDGRFRDMQALVEAVRVAVTSE